MAVCSSVFQIKTDGFSDIKEITPKVENAIGKSNISNGIAVVFVPGSTAGITTIEFEPGVIEDLKKAIERLAPQNIHYDHNARWGDGNGFAHVRAALLGPSISVPFSDGHMCLGTWQQIVLVDFDNRLRTREIFVQVIGE
jgi:secondary thiamine-phosphate synthase enzyme